MDPARDVRRVVCDSFIEKTQLGGRVFALWRTSLCDKALRFFPTVPFIIGHRVFALDNPPELPKPERQTVVWVVFFLN